MKLKDIMTHNVESVTGSASLVEAANMMARLDIGFLPVLEGDIIGVVTDRDIVVRAVAMGLLPADTSVVEVMTSDVEILKEDHDVKDLVDVMQEKQIRRVLVTDRRGGYVGVVSIGDLAVRLPEAELSGKALEQVCSE